MRTALQDADSVAGLLITTEATIGKPGLKGQATGGMDGGRIGETR